MGSTFMNVLVIIFVIAVVGFFGFELVSLLLDLKKRKRIKKNLDERSKKDVIEHEDKEN